MADVTLATQNVDRDGITESFTTLNEVDTYFVRASRSTILHFKNTGASPSTVTLDTPGNVGGLQIENPTVSVPATSGDVMVAAEPLGAFIDGSGELSFTQDQATGVSVAVVST